ncbi:MAG: hypothetical protein HDT14_01515 [Oscillibacter sp.]|nr:hypothetical protein [Oscillibacter sp.]
MSAAKRTHDREETRARLDALAREISSDLSRLESDDRKELLSDFVSNLFLATAEQTRREERRQKQAEGIAAAKAKGVRFGRTAKPLPDNFDEVHRAWRDGEISLTQAAEACGLVRGTFYGIAVRREQTENHTH